MRLHEITPAARRSITQHGVGKPAIPSRIDDRSPAGQDNIEQDDIAPTVRRRFRLPAGYPVLAEITLDPADWFRFERLVGDTPATRIVGHDDPHDGWLTVHVACASDEVRDGLEDGWG